MSAKRCGQLLKRSRELKLQDSDLHYLELHTDADGDHAAEVLEHMVLPLISENSDFHIEVENGARDRIARSEAFLNFYAKSILKL